MLFRKLEKEVNYNKNKPEQKVFSKKDLLLIFQVHDHRSTLLQLFSWQKHFEKDISLSKIHMKNHFNLQIFSSAWKALI